MRIPLIPFLLVLAASAQAQQHSDSVRVRAGRLVGVYDANSGQPLADVSITNVATGLSAKTTSTGTLSLFFVDTAGGMLRVRKVGYKPLTMLATNGSQDTTPLTVLLEPSSVQLGPVVTTARAHRGPADTVRALELNGFYDRRLTTGAPSSAFITSEKIERLHLVSDVAELSGRQICLTNLYLDGVRITAPPANGGLGKGRVPNNLWRNPADFLVSPTEVMAIEMYHSGEAPAEYNSTRPPNGPDCGVTLLWTKK
jgi:hypothetical protein